MNGSVARPWRALVIASADPDARVPRVLVHQELQALGFDANMWDIDAEVDPSTGTDGACVAALKRHQFIIAIVTAQPGSPIRMANEDLISAADVELLRALKVLPPPGSVPHPTVLHVELLGARAFGRPVIVFIDESLKQGVRDSVEELRRRAPDMRPAREGLPPAARLIEEGRWQELGHGYSFTGSLPIAYGHLVALQRVMNEGPDNWVEFVSFSMGGMDRLKSRLSERVHQLPLAFSEPRVLKRAKRVTMDVGQVLDQALSRSRGPLGDVNLKAMYESQALVGPPYEVNGQAGQGSVRDVAVAALGQGLTVLVKGDHGIGKSTWAALVATRHREDGRRVLFGRWRDLDATSNVIETLLGFEWSRDAWPLQLPDGEWAVVLDGLDESMRHPGALFSMFEGLSRTPHVALLTTCRDTDLERRFGDLKAEADSIIHLPRWASEHVDQYVSHLRSEGKEAAADLIALHRSHEREYLGYPLWLSMLTYLAEEYNDQLQLARLELSSDAAVLRACGDAFARHECSRLGIRDADCASGLKEAWGRAAYFLGREGVPVSEEDLLREVAPDGDPAFKQAVLSLLDPMPPDLISGFIHEVFQEFWLAETVVGAILSGDVETVVEVFRIFRSRLTNKLVRGRLMQHADKASSVLREIYGRVPQQELLVRNQVLYVIGRIDESMEVHEFLREIWRDDQEADFVRYSAAFAAVIAGAMDVEAEFATTLDSDEDIRAINLGHHRVYYDDQVSVGERIWPVRDDGHGPIDRTIQALLRRLKEKETDNRRLRRIELITLRQLVQSRSAAGAAISMGAVNELGEQLTREAELLDDQIAAGAASEIERLMAIVKS